MLGYSRCFITTFAPNHWDVRKSWHKKAPWKSRGIAAFPKIVIHSAYTKWTILFCMITVLLSSRLYCRFWNLTKSAIFMGRGLVCLASLPPVGNHTQPRRISICRLSLYINIREDTRWKNIFDIHLIYIHLIYTGFFCL